MTSAAHPPSHALTPLVLALLGAFPLASVAQTAITRATPPAAFVVPRPMPGWRVSGIGASAPLNRPNANGGTDQVINQTSQRAIYNWQSFDIGSASSVTFNLPSASGSALNRVIGSPTPSQIFGKLTSQYANPIAGQAPITGGSIYLINQNGILFGRTAQVNTSSLIASTLNLADSDFNAGLTQSINGIAPSFSYSGAPELFTDSANYVRVDGGATITTASGGRVFLFAKNVQNAGTITTPSGQTVLAAGAEVYLNDPTIEKLYASEVNPNIPVLRGLLVEVGNRQGNSALDGTASNVAGGVISTPRGNTTLVGMAVNQSGRISATTSVAENGSVMLLARGNTVANSTGGNTTKRAQTSGTLTLGAASQIEITPDASLGTDGKPLTSDATTTFTTSRVELAGKTIELQSGASIVAHGGIVDARAENMPNYDPVAQQTSATPDAAHAARLVIGDGAVIDVSGTTDTTVSVARNFVTTELLGKSDLKDAPLQRDPADSPLYRSKVTFDVRSGVPILGDTSAYTSAIKKTVDERLSAGGTIALTSTGALVTDTHSRLNVSGGAVTYTDAVVKPTQLISADGKHYTLNQAPADVLYVGIEGATRAQIDRWGIVPQYVPAQSSSGRVETGYVDGAAGGRLSLVAPTSLLDGQLQAATTAGARQASGTDAMAAAGRIELGLRSNGRPEAPLAPGSGDFKTAGLQDLNVTASAQTLPSVFWAAPLTADLPAASRIAASTLNASGAGQITVTTDGSLVQESGATIALAPKGNLDLLSAGSGGMTIGGGFTSAGGTFAAKTVDLGLNALNGPTVAGRLLLEAGQRIDLAGTWVNQWLDGSTAAPASAGGTATFAAAHGLILQDSSRIDVSGGATVLASGTVSGTPAGSITLQSNNVFANQAATPAPIHLGAVLKGQSLVGGGTLTVKTTDINIASRPLPLGVADGLAPGSLQLSDAFFRNGAFSTYKLDTLRSLTVQAGTTLLPQASNWIATADARNVATGTRPGSFLEEGQLVEAQRKPVNLAFTANGPGSPASGNLVIGSGSRIAVDPRGSVSLGAGLNLDMEGSIQAPGGSVSLALISGADTSTPVKGSLIVGSTATIDVSGKAVRQPSDLAVSRGTVLDGGSVSLNSPANGTRFTAIELRPGAVIDADGASALLSVDTMVSSGAVATTVQTVASEGGSISIAASDGGATLAGAMHANAGSASVAGGKFTLNLTGNRDPSLPLPTDPADRAVRIQESPVTTTTPVYGTVLLSAQTLRDGFADAAITAPDHITFNGSVDLAMPRQLVLNAPVLQALPGSKVSLSGGSNVQIGGTPSDITPAAAIGGSAELAVNGGLVELFGVQALQGFGQLAVNAGSELRFNSATAKNGSVGGHFSALADITLSAPQVLPTSNSAFTVDAPQHALTITGGDATAAMPMSAGGALTLNADTIVQDGVLRAPFGSLKLNATQSVTLGPGSLTSVSGDGLALPYGSTSGGTGWTYAGAALVAPAAKTINLLAPGERIDVQKGAVLDLSGGGHLTALEFVPGPGGSKDVFAGAAGGAFAIVPTIAAYAPQDADILLNKDLAGLTPQITLGQQITFGAGGPIPAGTYAVLPARYAVLDNAFLVRPASTTAPLALGSNVPKADGSVLVGGQFGSAGTGLAAPLPASFQVMTSKVARGYSEIRETDANDYFTAQAATASAAVPRLPVDAGRLNLVANAQTVQGSLDFGLPDDKRARGGELDISADHILVGGTTQGTAAAAANVLNLQPADLNATGAALVVLGGGRSGGDGLDLSVSASDVTVDNAGTPLKLADLVIVAKNRVELKPGADLESTGASTTAAPSDPLRLTGDGALLRLSSDPGASTTRTGVTRTTGDLVIGATSTLKAASIGAEGTHSATIAADATIAATSSLTLGASRLAVGPADPASVSPTTLLLTPALIGQIGNTESLTLRSFDGIDFYGSSSLGGTALRSLTIDTGSLRLASTAANPIATATITAGDVLLTNTSGAVGSAAGGTGTLAIKATGTAATAGDAGGRIVIGPGSLAVSGAANTGLDASRDVLMQGQAQLATGGSLSLRAAALTAAQGGAGTLIAGNGFSLDSSGRPAPDPAAAGAGAHVVINAATIAQNGRIVLPSGELSLTAAGAAGSDAVSFGSGSVTTLAGRTRTFDGVTIATAGGDLRVSAAAGNVVVGPGALIDVSAPDVAGRAGSVTISATAGGADVSGRLKATSALGQAGGSLVIDTAQAIDLNRLAATVDTERSGTLANFGESIAVRNRSGDQVLNAGGPALSARTVTIASDAGSLTIAGAISAGGGSEPTVTLAGGNALALTPSAQIGAHSSGPLGGKVELMTGTATSPSSGQLTLAGGTIDTSAASGGADGSVLLRAPVNGDGDDVRMGAIGTRIVGATQVDVEAVTHYATTVVDGSLMQQIAADTLAFAGDDGANASRILDRLAAPGTALRSQLRLRSGIEVDSTGNLLVTTDDVGNGWNLARFDDNGQPLPQASGAPLNLSLRAAGNLTIAASISDGFSPTGDEPPFDPFSAALITPSEVILPTGGANIRLVGGADLRAANVMATAPNPNAGDVLIGSAGNDVMVRTTTGSIQIAAGRDVSLLNRQAVVYTTGAPVDTSTLTGYAGNRLPDGSYLAVGSDTQLPFIGGGGSVNVTAGRDLLGATGPGAQYASEWLWVTGDQRGDRGSPMWYSRYDLFNQGFATFGGGNVTAWAGRDAKNVEVSAATSGLAPAGAPVQVFGGGDVRLTAQRDVVGGFVLAGRGKESVTAGRDIAVAATSPAVLALQVVYGNTQTDVSARNSADVGRATSFGLVGTVQGNLLSSEQLMFGLAPGASLAVQADSGDLTYRATLPLPAARHASDSGWGNVIPDLARFAAPEGNAQVGTVIQAPANDSRLDIVAEQNVTAGIVSVTSTTASEQSPTLVTGTARADLITPFVAGQTPFDNSGRSPVHVVAAEGDVELTNKIKVVRPVRIIAGNDIDFSGGPASGMVLQQQDATELSLLQAGRDLLLPASNNLTGIDVKVAGPGNLVATAGRNIDLRTSGGFGTVGNRENTALPEGSAAITLLAGVRLGSSDYTQATAWYFPVLGGTGIAGHAADLAAQLDALESGQPLPGLNSSGATAFSALTTTDQVTKAQALVGSDAFNAALLSFMRRHEANAALDLATAQTKFAALPDTDKSTVIGAALATAWAAQVPADQQTQQVLAMATAQGKDHTHTDALTAFVSSTTGRTNLSAAEALAAFAALPVERQLVFQNQVLVSEVRSAGRAASVLAGSERDAAYAKGYAAIDTVFPEFGTAGDMNMGSSQVRTYQNSAETILAPRGGINVGALTAASQGKAASQLGIVTAAGGDISLIVRDSVTVNQSRVFSVGKGDLLMWASEGNLDAGRGAKTVTGAPPPIYRIDAQGNFVVDTSGSFSGSGIAVLDAGSTLDLYAPKGEINAGDAGIKSLGNAYFGAVRFVGADNLSVGGIAVGAPPPAPTGGGTAGLASAGQSISAANQINPTDSDEEKDRKRRRRLNLILDFIGFGDGSGKS